MLKKANQSEITKYPIKTRLIAAILFLPSVILLISGIIMFLRTFGTQLLFIDSSIGMIFRNYWIFLIAAVVCLVAAMIIKRRLYKAASVKMVLEAVGDTPRLANGGVENDSLKDEPSKRQDNITEKAAINDKSVDPENDKNDNSFINKSNEANTAANNSDHIDISKPDKNKVENESKNNKADVSFDDLVEEAEKIESDKQNKKQDPHTCPECGERLVDGALFCFKCGKKLNN